MVAKQIRYLIELWKNGLASAMEYRMNFLVLNVSMFVNETFWIFFWYLIMEEFETINGWGFSEVVLLRAIAVLSLGLVGTLFGDTSKIARKIEAGELDRYLSFPKNIIIQATAKINYHSFGRVFFGVVVSLLILRGWDLLLWIILVLIATLTIFGFYLFVESLAFFAGRFEVAAQVARESLSIAGTYPLSAFQGTVRFIILFILPAGFISGVPVTLLMEFSWYWLGISLAVAIGALALGISLFYAGLRKYESGNVISMTQ